MSFVLRLDPKKRAAGRFIGRVRDELVRAFLVAKRERGLTQAALAHEMDVSRSRITRALKGEENLTLRSVAELATALDHEVVFSLQRRAPEAKQGNRSAIRQAAVNSPEGWPARQVERVHQGVLESAI